MIPKPLQNIADRVAVSWHERAVALKALSFGLVGIVNSVVDFTVFSFAYYYLALPIIAANTLAWAAKVAAIVVSFVVNFLLSHFVVFRAGKPEQL